MSEHPERVDHLRTPISGSDVYVYAAAKSGRFYMQLVRSSESESDTPLIEAPRDLFGGLNASKTRGFVLAYGVAPPNGEVTVHFSGKGDRDQFSVAADVLVGGIWIAEVAAPFDTVQRVVCGHEQVIVQRPRGGKRGRVSVGKPPGLKAMHLRDHGALSIPDDE